MCPANDLQLIENASHVSVGTTRSYASGDRNPMMRIESTASPESLRSATTSDPPWPNVMSPKPKPACPR